MSDELKMFLVGVCGHPPYKFGPCVACREHQTSATHPYRFQFVVRFIFILCAGCRLCLIPLKIMASEKGPWGLQFVTVSGLCMVADNHL